MEEKNLATFCSRYLKNSHPLPSPTCHGSLTAACWPGSFSLPLHHSGKQFSTLAASRRLSGFIKRRETEMNRHPAGKVQQPINTWKSSTPLTFRELQTEITLRVYLTPERTASIKKSANNEWWWSCVEEEKEPCCTVDGTASSTNTLQIRMAIPPEN